MDTKNDLTSALEHDSGVDLGKIMRSNTYKKEDISEANKDLEFLFDAAEGFVEQSKSPIYEQELRSYFEEKESFLEPDEQIYQKEEFSSHTSSTPKSSLRMQYEAEVEAIKKRIGELESIRKNLGLSQRKICQLLLVDPSAWTRWRKLESDAPLSIYRSLEWYCILQGKHPNMGNSFWLSSGNINENEKSIRELENKLKEQIQRMNAHNSNSLEEKMDRQFLIQKKIGIALLLWSFVLSALLVYKL